MILEIDASTNMASSSFARRLVENKENRLTTSVILNLSEICQCKTKLEILGQSKNFRVFVE